MADLFSGLEDLGFGDMKSMDLYGDEKKEGSSNSGGNEAKTVKSKEEIEKEAIFDKTYTCPVCDHEFKVKAIRTGKVKLLKQDQDLRPIYQTVDCLKYDAIICPKCGYAALSRFFPTILSNQAKAVREKITPNFKGVNENVELYTYDEAITKHKFALLNTVVKKGKNSEKAYTCLKLAWLCRGKRESLEESMEGYKQEKERLSTDEKEYLKNAFEGFMTAFSQEAFPMCGMDSDTVTYLVANLAFRIGKYEESSKWLSTILMSQTVKKAVKDKARDLKEEIMKLKKQ